MRVATVVHQQVSQIKWHALACLALIMVLPLEEAAASLLDGGGFYALGTVLLAIMLGPLLAGLIACANVQADLNDRRYIFWRSKPVGVKRFIALKYATGLIIALAIQACPIVFAIVTGVIFDEKRHMGEQMRHFIMLPVLLSVMTYSLCFACNVLVRKTARSWLIGMAVACLLLLLPFVLPLGYKDVVSDVLLWASGFYLAIMLVGSVGAFVFAILAAQYDLHLKTNLKGLLWAGAAVVFGLMMFAGGQVANIKVLAEVETPGRGQQLENVAGQIVLFGQGYLDVDNNALSFRVGMDSDEKIPYFPSNDRYYQKEEDGYTVSTLPYYRDPKLYKIGDDIYSFSVHDYYVEEETEDHKGKTRKVRIHEKLYLRCFKFADYSWTMVSEFDLADCMRDRTSSQYVALGLIEDRLVALVNRSCLVLDVAEPSKPKIVEKKIDVLKRPVILRGSRPEQLAIPLIPLENMDVEQRIRISIDRNFRYFRHRFGEVFEPSIVDIHEGEISFYLVSKKEIFRYDVTRWDDETIYCRRSTARPFTIMERMVGGEVYDWFVKNGQLYLLGQSKLMVFDVRHDHRIRKTGHFVRMRSWIEDLEVLDDGNMLLTLVNQGRKRGANSYTRAVYLLENPG